MSLVGMSLSTPILTLAEHSTRMNSNISSWVMLPEASLSNTCTTQYHAAQRQADYTQGQRLQPHHKHPHALGTST